MLTFMRHRSLAVLAGIAALGLAAPEASAQNRPLPFGVQPYFQVARGLNIQQLAYNTALMGRAYSAVPPYALGYNPYLGGTPYVPPAISPGISPYGANPYASLYANPYSAYANPNSASLTSTSGIPGYSGYDNTANPYGGSGYGESSIGGYMRGIADIANAQGRVVINIEQARLLHEQVRRERLENRRRVFDQYLYFRDHTPSPEDDRQKAQAEFLKRSLNDPPVGDIVSAQSLNTLLADIQKKSTKDTQAPNIPLDESVLRHVNVKPPTGAGNPGLLKNEGKLSWPSVLRGPQYQKEKESLDELAPTAYEQTISGGVRPTTLKDMTNAVQQLQQKLADNIKELTPTQYGEARRFLGNFEDALSLLRQPNAGEYFKAAKGKTIGDLVRYMTQNGLVFAPAVPGGENAYVALQRALAVYDSAASAQVVAEKPEKEK